MPFWVWLQHLATRLRDLFRATECAVYLRHKGEPTLTLWAYQGEEVPEAGKASRRLDEGAGGSGLVRGSGLLAAPIRAGDVCLGIVQVRRDPEAGFSQEEADVLGTVASSLAQPVLAALLSGCPLLHGCDVYDEAQQRLAEVSVLYEVGRGLSSTLDLSRVLESVTRLAVKALRARTAILRLVDRETGELRLASRFDLEGGAACAGADGPLAEVVRQGKAPALIPDLRQSPPFAEHAGSEPASAVCAPLFRQEVVIGTLGLYGRVGGGSAEAAEFGETDLQLLVTLCTQVAVAIENAQLFSAAERRASELATLREIGQAITTRLELSAVLEAVVAGAMRLLGSQFAQIILWDEASQRLRYGAAVGPEAERVRTQIFELGRGINGTVALTRKPMILDDYQASPYALPEFPDIVATITAPVLFGEQLLGVLHSHTTQPGKRFRPDDLRLFQMLAAQAAIAIENARLYEAIRQHAAALEQRVQERTQELAAANQQLQEASRRKSEFLANMSHELRTPLNSVIGFAELLRERSVGPLTERQARYVGHIYQGGKHLLQLISDILDLSKVEAGKFVLQPEPIPVAQTLEDILVIARGLANKKAQEIQADIAPGLPPLNADPVRFKQILFNLLSNAIKFTPEHGTITVTAKQVTGAQSKGAGEQGSRGGDEPSPLPPSPSAPQQFLEVGVQDTGTGIRPEDLPRLFQEFVQLETTQAQKHEGSGLGLALTKRLVELHGGRIRAESAGEGQGSSFTVALPFGGPSGPEGVSKSTAAS